MNGKYEDIIRNFLLKEFDNDEEFLSLSMNIAGITYQQPSDEIEVGVKNGYTIEYQLSILKSIL